MTSVTGLHHLYVTFRAFLYMLMTFVFRHQHNRLLQFALDRRKRLILTPAIVFRFLHPCCLRRSTKMSPSIAFTRNSRHVVLAIAIAIAISYGALFWEYIIDISLTWTRHVRWLKRKLNGLINIIKLVRGARWGSSVSEIFELHSVICIGLPQCSLP